MHDDALAGSGDPESLTDRIEVAPSDTGVYRTSLESFWGQAFGGEVLAKAVAAAGLDCTGVPHSLHGFFLRVASPEAPIELRVERLRDGRRISHRRVGVWQHDRQLAEFGVACQGPPEGHSYEEADAWAGVPGPDGIEPFAHTGEDGRERPGPFEWRYVDAWWSDAAHADGRWRAWVRPRRELPEDPRLHAAALAYLSDFGSLATYESRFGDALVWDESTSLDHALWLHPEPRFDDWVLMESRSPVAQRGRGILERVLWARDGTRLATVVQEALFTLREPQA